MKNSRRHIVLATISIVSLLLLVAVQIIYIVKAAHKEEVNFSHLATLAATKAQQEITSTFPACCQKSRRVVGQRGQCRLMGIQEQRIDSIINKHLLDLSLDLDYTFVIQALDGNTFTLPNDSTVSNASIKPSLRIEFPDRTQFFIRQMQGVFASSIVFILIIFLAFLQLLRLLKLEKQKHVDTENFVNNMIHEFQTPISNIQLSTNLLLKKMGNPSAEIVRLIEIIQNENNRLKSNAFKILDASNCVSIKREPVRLHVVISEALAKYAENHSRIDFIPNAVVDTVLGSKDELSHLVSNLIDNAIKYNRADNAILISTQNSKDAIIITVADNGIGIAKENLKRIFDKYVRLENHTVHNIKGFGLGLAYVKQIVENLKGSISVESKLDEGSKFHIKIPIYTPLK